MKSEKLSKIDVAKGVNVLMFFLVYGLLYAFVFGFGGLAHVAIGGVGSLIFVVMVGGRFWSWLEEHIDEN